jgi:hypothetical protein
MTYPERERGAHHFVHDVDCFTKAVCLETDAFIRGEQCVQRWTFVKVGALHRDGVIWHRFRLFKDGSRGAVW